jgi:hypothetical protein
MNVREEAEKLSPEESIQEKPAVPEISPVEQENAGRMKVNYDGDRIMSSIGLLTSKSIKELEGLTFELHGLQEFLKSETERVQRDIDNALAGLKIIIETISPWRSAQPESSLQEKTSRSEPRLQRSWR